MKIMRHDSENGNISVFIRFLPVYIEIIAFLIVFVSPVLANYTSDVNSFINDVNWKDGASWGNIGPKATSGGYSGCAAYAADFAYKTWASHPPAYNQGGIHFYDPSQIQDGDVIHVYGDYYYNADNELVIDQHYYCVIQRKPDGSLYTAEGNWGPVNNKKVWITTGHYSMSSLYIFGTKYIEGWHNPNYEPYSSDDTSPTVSNCTVSEVTSNGYRVTCNVSDNVGVTDVKFPTWTINNGDFGDPANQDDLNWHQGENFSGGTATYYVSVSDHNNERNVYYATHIYAWDAAGNPGSAGVTVFVPLTDGSPMISGYDRVLPDGNYIIAATENPYFYLDIVGTGTANDGANVHIWFDNPDGVLEDDIWTITYDSSSKFYTINQKNTNMCLAVEGSSTASGANVQTNSCNNSSAQKWAISRNGINGYRVQPQCSGGGSANMSMDITASNYTAGTNVQMAVGNNSNAQSWLFIPYKPSQPVAEGRYVLLYAPEPVYELDVAGDSADVPDQTNVQIWDENHASSKYNSFDFIKLSNGYYKVKHAASGKCLEVAGATTGYYSNVAMWPDNGSLAQQWAVIPNGTGYSLIVRNSGYAIDVADGITGNGKNLAVFPRYWNDNQRWTFVKAEYSVNYNANGGTGAPSGQTKYYKEDLTINSTIPVRAGYSFKNWNTKADGTGTSYWPGTNYTTDANVTLYAQWVEGNVTFGSCGTNVEYAIQNGTITFTKENDASSAIFQANCADVFRTDADISKVVIDAPMNSSIVYPPSFKSAAYVQEMDLNNLDVSQITSFYLMFDGCAALTRLDISNWDTSNVTSMNRMFSGCSELTSLNVSGFNTANVTDMNWMFYGCTGLTGLDLSGWNTADAIYTNSMFYGCSGLTDLNVSSWNTTNVTDIYRMFFGCTGLTGLDLSGWDTSNVTEKGSAFSGCDNLTALTLGENTLGINIFDSLPSYDGPWIYMDQGVSASDPLPIGTLKQSNLFTAYTPASMAGTWVVYDILEITEDDILLLPPFMNVISGEAFTGIAADAIYIPSGVAEIGSRAFASSPNLKIIHFENGDNISVAEDFVSGCNCDLIIDAPKNSVVAGNINTYRQYLSCP